MKILRIAGYAVAFVVILLVVSIAQRYLLATFDLSWPELLERAVAVIVTWAVFWMAIWRPMGRRMERQQQTVQSRHAGGTQA